MMKHVSKTTHMVVVNNDKDNIYANFDTMREIVVDTVRDQ